MNLFQAVLLGVIEGITEFLPVSSTGHLLLTNHLLGLNDAFSETFAIAIQSGAMVAVLASTWRDWINWPVLLRVACGFFPTAILGLLLYPFVKGTLFGPRVVIVALVVGALAILLVERWVAMRPVSAKAHAITSLEALPLQKAALIGSAQALAMIPGVSRSAATIFGGLLLGVSRETVVRYSFLLAVPTIGAATVLDLWKQRALITPDNLLLLLVGMAVSGLVAALTIRLFLRYVREHTFTVFAVERVLVAVVAWWFLWR